MTMNTIEVNGQAKLEDLLTDTLTPGYKPSLPATTFWNPDGSPNIYVYRDLEAMLTHPTIVQSLQMYDSGIYGAEFEAECKRPEVTDFILKMVERFWDRAIRKTQMAYRWGWMGAETIYEVEEGFLKFDQLKDFAPRDVKVLTIDDQYVGVRVKRGDRVTGNIDLWGPREIEDESERILAAIAREPTCTPAKGFWYAHNVRYSQWYGVTQLVGSWYPWKRLAGPNGAETVIDGGVYRFAYMGPIIRYPAEDYQRARSQGGGTPAMEWARDRARQMGESLKAGATVALSSSKYPTDQGGHYKWELEWPDHTINVDPLINYAKMLKDEISYGIGVPPELMQAADTGSGYSGRRIPLDAFLMHQQSNADLILRAFKEQILDGLIAWNFGPDIQYEVKVKSLLKTKSQQTAGQEKPQQPGLNQNDPNQPKPMFQSVLSPKKPEPAAPTEPEKAQGSAQNLLMSIENDTLRIYDRVRQQMKKKSDFEKLSDGISQLKEAVSLIDAKKETVVPSVSLSLPDSLQVNFESNIADKMREANRELVFSIAGEMKGLVSAVNSKEIHSYAHIENVEKIADAIRLAMSTETEESRKIIRHEIDSMAGGMLELAKAIKELASKPTVIENKTTVQPAAVTVPAANIIVPKAVRTRKIVKRSGIDQNIDEVLEEHEYE
jgi:hypothetical protein